MNEAQIHELLGKAFAELQHFDKLILKRKPKEECINHRFAFYLEILFPQIIHDDMFYNVDIEYNRNLEEKSKDVENEPDKFISIRPDIIIHKRADNRDNLLAIEAKYGSLHKHDILKLEKLLLPPFNYAFSVGISYLPKQPYFRYILLRLEEKVVLSSVTRIKKED